MPLRVRCSTDPGETVLVAGSCAELGSWRLEQAPKLSTNPASYPQWSCVVHFSRDSLRSIIDFKFVVVRLNDGIPPVVMRWEGIEGNRKLSSEMDVAEFGCLLASSGPVLAEMPADGRHLAAQPNALEPPEPGPAGRTEGRLGLYCPLHARTCTRPPARMCRCCRPPRPAPPRLRALHARPMRGP